MSLRIPKAPLWSPPPLTTTSAARNRLSMQSPGESASTQVGIWHFIAKHSAFVRQTTVSHVLHLEASQIRQQQEIRRQGLARRRHDRETAGVLKRLYQQ